jgi:prepilin-type N-terminal cleavage/methylation domain-containing protein
MNSQKTRNLVIPAKAGIQIFFKTLDSCRLPLKGCVRGKNAKGRLKTFYDLINFSINNKQTNASDLKHLNIEKDNGFSLVELIASLTIAGILAVALMTIVVTALNGFSLSRDAAGISQKASMALARIRIELLNATDIVATNDDYVEYDSNDGATYKIYRDSVNNQITLERLSATQISAQTLIDNISSVYGADSFLEYTQSTGAAWTPPNEISDLYAITVKLKFTNYNDMLATTINPRLNTLRNSPRFND